MDIEVQLVGAEVLSKALQQLPKELASPFLGRALRKAAKPVVDDARSRARRSKLPQGRRGGAHMADTIAVYDNRFRRTAANRRSVELAIGYGSKQFHGFFVEFDINMPPGTINAFLRPAWKRGAAGTLNRFAKDTWKTLERAAARWRRQAEAGKLSPRVKKVL